MVKGKKLLWTFRTIVGARCSFNHRSSPKGTSHLGDHVSSQDEPRTYP